MSTLKAFFLSVAALIAILCLSAFAAEKTPVPTVHATLTNQMEFFAEMTECYFGSNGFYPFGTGELKQAEPETFALMAAIWGPLPGTVPSKAKANS